MILHRCDRCGSLSDEGVRAQNNHDDWVLLTYRGTDSYQRDGGIVQEIEICKQCKDSFLNWKKKPVTDG